MDLLKRADDEQRALIKALRDAWRSFERSYRWAMGVSKDPTIIRGQMRSDLEIGRDFLYGDLVHADPEARRRLRHVPEGDRLLAAVVWVADATKLTLATKQLVIDLTDAGVLSPRP